MATIENHGQMSEVMENGDVNVFYPKTFSSDVYVNSNNKTLETFLGNSDISSIGDGTVSGAISDLHENAGGIELTQAEYDELTPEEQASGTYYITDGGSGQTSLTVDQVLNNTSFNPISNKAVTQQFAGNVTGTFEPSAIAQSAHAVGEYFMWIGQFVKTTAKISVGDTISTNTNVSTTNVVAVLSELKYKEVSFTDFSQLFSMIQNATNEEKNLLRVVAVDVATGASGERLEIFKGGGSSGGTAAVGIVPVTDSLSHKLPMFAPINYLSSANVTFATHMLDGVSYQQVTKCVLDIRSDNTAYVRSDYELLRDTYLQRFIYTYIATKITLLIPNSIQL